uniref:HYD1 n=1 Tax=Arundo donax TaxID=35708 RepID=A0A0A9DQN6_ARUDO
MKKYISMAPNVFMYELCLPHHTNASQHPRSVQLNQNVFHHSQPKSKFLLVINATPASSTRQSNQQSDQKQKNLGASGAALHATVEIKCSGRFARAPSPAPRGHQPPPAPLVPGTAHTARPHTCPCGVSCERQPLAGSRARWRWGRRGSGGGPGHRGRTCRPCRTA